ncbi:MAG: NAD(P)-binding protein [Gammaproteobacteria bacterium]|nr:NAD(P)-binding protein [Gammaproteobacteria bacterium]
MSAATGAAGGRDPRFDILFEPVRIGPVVARNRFFQVPHCNGMGHLRPRAHAAMRGVKAEGGWAVVSTEEVEIHPSSDLSPYVEGRLWDERDVAPLALLADAVHAHGALAAIELVHAGINSPNHHSREDALAPSHSVSPHGYAPFQAREMSRADIRAYRDWHRTAALRARRAGFDVIYVYAAHDLSLAMHFLLSRHNHRRDEYGGLLENRVRILRELVEDTREAVGDRCAVAVRLAVDEKLGAAGLQADGEGRDIVAMLAELPDLWDVNVSGWANDSATSRFAPEGHQEDFVRFVKRVTSKPVVGVGRFTSPDAMVAQIRRGVLDFIGAARPSIADPFLPRKIETGAIDEIRECIGCNVCVSGDYTATPIRCTQNPTMGEEWRRGWHPERVPVSARPERFLIVGSGPAGLECARVLAARGHEVQVADTAREPGGRVTRESRLPGLAAWARVRDYRLAALRRSARVGLYLDSEVSAELALDSGAQRIVIATGARWRRDGVGRANRLPVTGFDSPAVLTPEDLDRGLRPRSPVVVFDDDHYYLGGVLAERLRAEGLEVTLVTPAPLPSAWTVNTLEQRTIHRRLLELGVDLVVNANACGFDGERLRIECTITGRQSLRPAANVVTVTSRLPEEELLRALAADPGRLEAAGVVSLAAIGDCAVPGTIAAAVYSGHRYAREFDCAGGERPEPLREYAALD